jgi:5-hydroxyisourate hydrolase-like protein (transthyretin family)
MTARDGLVRADRDEEASAVIVSTQVADAALGGSAVEVAEMRRGTGRLEFDTSSAVASSGRTGFHPHVSVASRVTEPEVDRHAPLLRPFAYSTYRGS